jgi:O-antigen ligase
MTALFGALGRQDSRIKRPRGLLPEGFGLVAGFAGLAVAVGVEAVKKPSLAAAIVVALVFVVVVATHIVALPLFLAATIFVEEVSFGGLTVGRIAGVLALFVMAYYLLSHGRATLKVSPLLGVAGAYGLWILTSALWADQPGASYTAFFGYLLVISFMLTFALLVKNAEQVIAIFKVLVFGAAVSGFVAVDAFFITGSSSRATGLLGAGHEDVFGVYQAMIAPIALGLFALTRRAEFRLAYLGCLAVIAFSIASSLTRTAMISVVGVAAVALVLPWRVLFRSAAQKATYAVAVGGMMGLLLTVGASATLFSRIGSIFSGFGSQGDRGAGRTDLWAAAWRAYNAHPWFGIGAGNFQAHSFDLLTQTQGVDIRASYVGQGRPVHNAYLESLTELGPIGLLLLALVIALAGWSLIKLFRTARASNDVTIRIITATLLLALISLAVSFFFLSIELNKPLWIIVGLTVALERITHGGAHEQQAPEGMNPASTRHRAHEDAALPSRL